MSRDAMIAMARRHLAHARAGTVDQAPDVYRVPASDYVDPRRWQLEIDRIFKRFPLMLGLGCEIAEPGAYKAIEAAGVPVLMTRGSDGSARAFVNACSHRGAQLVDAGTSGTAHRFSCPYHGWTYDADGALRAITDERTFGAVDKSCLGLTPLPVAERAGLVFVVLDPAVKPDFDAFLCGYDSVLRYFDFGHMHLVARNVVTGPNWKIAYDGYLDFYHLPILHKASFGPQMSRDALYDAWGPHQRVSFTDLPVDELDATPEEGWDADALAGGVWTIFPHVSYAGGPSGGMFSQLFPGPTPDRSITVQSHFVAEPPDDAARKAAQASAEFLLRVVRDEDYATGLRIQTALETGAKTDVLFGRNEGGGQRFHQWLDRLVDEPDADAAYRRFSS